MAEEPRGIENEAHFAITADGGAGETGNIAEVRADGLDDGFFLSDELVNDQADAALTGSEHDDAQKSGSVARLRRESDGLMQPANGNHAIAEAKHVRAVGAVNFGGADANGFDNRAQRAGHKFHLRR